MALEDSTANTPQDESDQAKQARRMLLQEFLLASTENPSLIAGFFTEPILQEIVDRITKRSRLLTQLKTALKRR